mmetsp:Transcript_18976/g.55774  ORF Transcript_18976/g.55774 Transcript_18976/m.55774 type:complete len:197 (+) Transcript_18976:127-717(+)
MTIVERELVPFFPTDDANTVITPQRSPDSSRRRARKPKKSPQAADEPALDVALEPIELKRQRSKGSKKLPPKGVDPADKKPQVKAKKAGSPPRGAAPQVQTPVKGAFAGAAFEQSPDPSSLPKPRLVGSSLLAKSAAPVDTQEATKQLRSLLGVMGQGHDEPGPRRADPPTASLVSSRHDALATHQLRAMLGVAAC